MSANKIVRRIFSFILFFSVSVSFASESNSQLRFTHINTANYGLSYNSVRCILEDSRGFVWIGTYNGLNRYDGVRMKTYGVQQLGIISGHIYTLAEDAVGNVLIGTDDGLVIYDYSKDTFRHPSAGDNFSDRVYAIKSDSYGRAWIGTRMSGMYVYNPCSDELRRYPLYTAGGNEVVNIYRIAICSNDRVWLASYCDNIYCIGEDKEGLLSVLEVASDEDYFVKDDVEGLVVSSKADNILYVASKRHGLCEVDVITGKVTTLCSIPVDSRPVELAGGGRYLWFSTTSGLVKYDLMTNETVTLRFDKNDRFSLSDDYIHVALPDKKGGLWVGTAHGGADYWSPQQDVFRKYYQTSDGEALTGCVVSDFAQDDYGNLWVATEREGLLLHKRSSGNVSRYISDALPNRINAICYDGGMLWVGYHQGLCRLDIKSGTVRYFSDFSESLGGMDNRVLDIFRATDGDLYIATSVGMICYESSTGTFRKVECLGNSALENVVQDDKGIVWVASYSSGVYAYNPEKKHLVGHWCVKEDGSVIPEMTSSMCLDVEGNVWTIGFSSGFFKYNPFKDGFEAFNMSNTPSLPSEIFQTALSDDDGNLWLASDKGLVEYNPVNGYVKVYGASSGILDEKLGKSSIRLKDGTMAFGSANGFFVFSPDRIGSRSAQYEVAISDIVVGDDIVAPSETDEPLAQNINIEDRVELRSDCNSFGFHLSSPKHGAVAGVRLLCTLEGYDEQWRDVSADMDVYFYNVPPGKYLFRMATVDSNGQYVDAHKPVEIVVKPEFWRSTAGILIIMLIVVSAFLFVYRRQEKLHKEKQNQLMRAHEIEALREKMTFFSNVIHEIRTPLTLIRTPLQNIMASDHSQKLKDDLSIISNSTDYLDQLVRELLDFVRVEQHGYVLDLKNVDVVDKLSYACFNFKETAKERNLKLSFEHDDRKVIIAADPKALYKIFNNLLHNAIKYSESYVNVTLHVTDEFVDMIFSNDGPRIEGKRREDIFKPFVQFSSDHAPYSQSFGIGLSFARSLAELHGGSLTLAESQDTSFVLRLPNEKVKAAVAIEHPQEEISANPSLPLLMLVEDNHELQTYLKRKLKEEYNVVSASSAEKAFEMLGRLKVDMILTDIALQGMSGIELCRKVSTDFATSHIPVVVLSAISSVDTKIKCMESGAAIYIEKPFTLDYLKACIHSLLARRRHLKELYQDVGHVDDMTKYDLADRDEGFIRKLDKVVMQNLSDPDFAVRHLEEALCMSRSSLTRKMRALLDIKPVDYIRDKRLMVAAEMLKTNKGRVKEVCFAAGFNSSSYFAKCFRQKYGVLPTEYAGNMAETVQEDTNSPKDETN